MNLPFFIARRYLFHQKGSFAAFIIRIAAFATALSVAVMVIALAFISGFKQEIRGKLFSFWGHVHIAPHVVNASDLITPDPILFDPALVKNIRSLPYIVQVFPYAVRPAILQANGLMEGIKLKGVPPQYQLPKGIDLKGSFIRFNDTAYSNNIVLSERTADRLQLKMGDALQIYFLEPGSSPPRIRKLIISGIYHTGMEEIDKEYAVCDLALLQRINGWTPDQCNGYQVDMDNADKAIATAEDIRQRFTEPPITTYTMQDIYQNVFDWLKVQDINVQILLVIMAIVAIINIAAVLLILMVDRAQLIGLVTALGMAPRDIRKIFFSLAALISIAGILLGDLIGIGICTLQIKTGFLTMPESFYAVGKVAVNIDWQQLLILNIAVFFFSLAWMWLPALYIRRIQPAKVLQFK